MYDFEKLLHNDSQTEYEYPDERLISTLRLTSLSYSLREERNSEDFQTKNNWLFSDDDKNGIIPTINFDVLKVKCDCENMKSFDAFFYDYNDYDGKHLSLLIEFKNCDKDELEKKFLDIDSKNNDALISKIKDSKNIIASRLNFNGKYSCNELISKTHIIIVYGGKNNIPAMNITLCGSEKSIQTTTGRQKRPSNFQFTKKVNEYYSNFGKEVERIGFAFCNDNYFFPVRGNPEYKKEKGVGRIRYYSLFSSIDFKEIIENDFFKN